MPKTFKYRLYPSQEQKEKLEKTLETCRLLYNDFLAERRDKYEKEKGKITCFEQINSLPDKKEKNSFLKEVHSQVLQDVARRVNKSFQNFFRRLKTQAGKAGYPRFKQYGRYDSFTYPQSGFNLRHSQLVLFHLGKINIEKHRKLEGKIKTCSLIVNNRSFVPVPTKLKHPIIKNWNASNYWYSKKLDLNNLERGCVRIYEDNWKNCYIGWLDIDCKKWTKIAKKYAWGYVKSPKGHIRIPFLFRNRNQEKTGTLYYEGKKIGDAKISGEVMLPGNAYYDKEGKKLGYYEWKHWGTFFPKRNYIFKNPTEFWELLKQDFGIEYKSISQHLIYQKTHTEIDYTPLELYNIPVKEPPWQKMITTTGIQSQNRQ